MKMLTVIIRSYANRCPISKINTMKRFIYQMFQQSICCYHQQLEKKVHIVVNNVFVLISIISIRFDNQTPQIVELLTLLNSSIKWELFLKNAVSRKEFLVSIEKHMKNLNCYQRCPPKEIFLQYSKKCVAYRNFC